MAGGGARQPNMVNLAELCDGVAAEISLALRGRPVLISVLCAAQATMETDAVILRRILSNLFGTAAAFTQRGGICLRIERTETEVFLDLRTDALDTSPAPSLATTQQLVALLGGRIETERGAATGRVFRLVLPASVSAPEAV